MLRYCLLIVMICVCVMLPGNANGIGSQPLPVDPNLKIGVLSNGLTYYIYATRQNPNRATFQLAVKTGSVQEQDDQQGYAHLIEHMAFRGTKNFPGTQVLDYLDSIGLGKNNGLGAATTIDMINYEMQLPTDDPRILETGLHILRDWAQDIAFDETALYAERDIVLEEMRGKTGLEDRIRRRLLAVVYQGSRYSDRLPVGKQNTLGAVTKASITQFYRDWFRPDLQAVIVVGDFDPNAMETMIIHKFGDMTAQPGLAKPSAFIVPDRSEPAAIVITDPEIVGTNLQLIWNRDRVETRTVEDYRRNLISSMVISMAENRVKELTDKPDAPFSQVRSQGFVNILGKANTSFYLDTQAGKEITALSAIVTEIERIRQYGFLPSEFHRAKASILEKAQKSAAAYASQDSKTLAWKCFGHFCMGSPFMNGTQNIALTASLLDSVGLEDVNKALETVYPINNLVIALTAPEQETPNPLPVERDLLQAYASAREAKLSPYIEADPDSDVFTNDTPGGRILREIFHPKSGISEWKLSNGITVLGKQSNLGANEVLIQALRPGGTNLYPLADLPSAQMAARYVIDNGVEGLGINDLNRIKTARQIEISPYITSSEEGYSVTCSAHDLDMAFQLINMYATAPRFDDTGFQTWITRLPIRLQAHMQPELSLIDSVTWRVYSSDPRMAPVGLEQLGQINLETLTRVYRERLMNFADFTFIVVGDYDESQVKALCEKYLAGLPATRQKQPKPSPAPRLFTGMQRFELFKGVENKSMVVLAMYGRCGYDQTSKDELALLNELVNEKLWQNVRQSRSGAYYIQADAELAPPPESSYRLYVAFQCDPARVDEMSDVVLATLDSLSSGDIGTDYAESTAMARKRRAETDRNDLHWWLDETVFAVRSGHYKQNLPQITPIKSHPGLGELRRIARKYLTHRTNLVRGVLYPAGYQP